MAERLGESLGDDEADIRQRVQSGELLVIEWGGELVSVTGIDYPDPDDAPELVITCLSGRNLTPYMPELYRLAQCNGCTTIRYHSHRSGIARIARAYGFKQQGRDDSGRSIYRCWVE